MHDPPGGEPPTDQLYPDVTFDESWSTDVGDDVLEEPKMTKPAMRAPETEGFPTGPDIGERLPDITLPDQLGRSTNIEQARGNRRALIIFHRSLDW